MNDQVYSVCASGRVNVWECDTSLDGLIPYKPPEDTSLSVEISDGEEEEEKEDIQGE